MSYDYTAINKCLEEPLKAQYNGGIIVNPEINEGLKGWTTHGGVRIEARSSNNKGNNFLVAHSRTHPYGSVSQKLFLEKDKLYTFSAWIQVSGTRNVPVSAVFKTSQGFKPAGSVIAQAGCWSMLKGGLTVDFASSPAELFFQSNDTSIDIWVDSVSLQPFTKEEWRSHQDQSIEKVRKSKVRLQVLDAKGSPLRNTNISLTQTNAGFPIGAAMNQNILKNNAYQNWYIPRFKLTTFENEMKWYSTEKSQGTEDYSVPDAMLAFTSQHGIKVRGHNIFWEDPHYQPNWLANLSPGSLKAAADKRISSVVNKYKGKVIAWDVDNENLHFNFFTSKLGGDISGKFYQSAHMIDGQTTLFMNDYNTIEDSRDGTASASNYLKKLEEIRKVVGNGAKMAIGAEGHFGSADIAYMRSALDTLASAKVPIWITELDVSAGPNQASYLEQILREAHSHPAIQGIVIWAAWSPRGCYRMCLTDNNFKNLPTGDVVDKLFKEWGINGFSLDTTTDAHGFIHASLFHGDYQLNI